jgi:DNA-binding transcriptional ArsR family regulator
MRLKEWVKLPTDWIRSGGLTALRWSPGIGSDNTAALMTLIRLAHRADDEGVAKATYDDLSLSTGLSRAKVSGGLTVLEEKNIVARIPDARSTFALVNFNPKQGWGKLPARRLYSGDRIAAFSEYKLRNSAELNALKIYLLAVAFRDNGTNLANLSYDKFEELAGIDRARIRAALSVLTYGGMLHTERVASKQNIYAVSHGYRVIGVDPYRHGGTTGHSDVFADMIAEQL